MPLNTQPLQNAFVRYIQSIHNLRLSPQEKSIDLRHMHFWYPYYAQVVEAVASEQKPTIEKRTLKEINSRSQIDYKHFSDTHIELGLRDAHEKLIKNLPKVPANMHIPYRKGSHYVPHQYQEVVITHLKMHWKYLDKLAGK